MMAHVSHEPRIESDQRAGPLGDGAPKVVVPTLSGNSAEKPKGIFMAANKVLEFFTAGEFDIQVSRETQHHGKAMHLHTVMENISELPPIDLGAFPRFEFQS
jgi:hypothetical protein